MRFQKRPWFSKMVIVTRLQRWPVLLLHEISLTVSLVLYEISQVVGVQWLSALFCQQISKTAGLSSLYEIAKVAGFVPSRDFTYGQFSSVTRSHGRSAFSGCRLFFCHEISKTSMALKDDFLYEIAKAPGFVSSRDFTDGRFSSVIRSHGGSAFSSCQLCYVMRFQKRPWF